MARWTEEHERWMGPGTGYGEDERRFRERRGEEAGWRGRDWRGEDRIGAWRGERGGEWREPGRGRFMEDEEEWSGRDLADYGRGRESGHGRWRGERWGGESEGPYRRYYGGAGGMDPYSGGRAGMYGAEEYGGYRGEPGEWGYEGRRREGRYYRPEERGPFERMGERLKEGMRKLTGRGPKGYRRSDERIRDDVSERIARSWVNAEDVEVSVEQSEVTLSGSVESREEKREIEDIAEDVFGVEEVHNQIRLRRSEGLTAGTGTTGTGAAMSAQQQGRGAGASQPGQAGRH